jgi:hypothetical protein
MASPFVLVTTHRIRPDRLQQFAAVHDEYVRFIEEHEPRMLAHHTYMSDGRTEVSLLQVHPDADAADDHLQLVAPRLTSVTDIVDNTFIEVYGAPGPVVQAALDRNSAAGVAVRVTSHVLGGFDRQ